MADTEKSGPLQLGSLRAAIQALANTLDVTASPEFRLVNLRWRDTLIAGVVQHFEFTFELCWKMLPVSGVKFTVNCRPATNCKCLAPYQPCSFPESTVCT